MGADAGVLRLALLDGTDAIVTVRNVPQTDAQLAFIQPVSGALADWRGDAVIEISLLVCAGLVLLLIAGGFLYLVPSSGAAEEDDQLAEELTEALPGCGVWRWKRSNICTHFRCAIT